MSVTEEKKPHHGFQSYGNWQREEDLYVWPCSLWAFDEDVNMHNHRNKNMYIYSYCFFIGAGSVLSSKGQKSAYSGRCLASLWVHSYYYTFQWGSGRGDEKMSEPSTCCWNLQAYCRPRCWNSTYKYLENIPL